MINIENPLIQRWYTRSNNKVRDKITNISLLSIKVYTPHWSLKILKIIL